MRKLLAAMFMMAGTAGVAMAGRVALVPEVSPTATVGALTLLGGAVLVVRALLKR